MSNHYSHDEFDFDLDTITELIRMLRKFEMKCYYNPTPATRAALQAVSKELSAACDSQVESENFDREAQYV